MLWPWTRTAVITRRKKLAFEQAIDLMMDRLAADPEIHV